MLSGEIHKEPEFRTIVATLLLAIDVGRYGVRCPNPDIHFPERAKDAVGLADALIEALSQPHEVEP